MLEHLDKSLIGYYFRERITNPENSMNRDNQQERLELEKFIKSSAMDFLWKLNLIHWKYT